MQTIMQVCHTEEQSKVLPACPCASLAQDPSETISKMWTWEKATAFSKDTKSSSLKRQLFTYLGTPLSKESYLPTSPAPPTGTPVDASSRGVRLGGNPFLQMFQWLLAAIWWPRQALAGAAAPRGTPPRTSAAPWHSQYCTACLQTLLFTVLTKKVWMHFPVQTLQQHNILKPCSPPQKCKVGDLICRSLVQKCKPHHPIKQIICYNFL